MEPLFSNACSQTRENLHELIKATVPSWYRLYCRIFTAVFIIAAVILIFAGQYLFTGIFIALAVIMLAIYNVKISSAAKKIWQKNYDLYKKDVETRIFFYEDAIVGKNLQSGNAVRTEYEKIEKIVETRSLYVLVFCKNIAILVDKEGFLSENEGVLMDFDGFIRKKCVNAK